MFFGQGQAKNALTIQTIDKCYEDLIGRARHLSYYDHKYVESVKCKYDQVRFDPSDEVRAAGRDRVSILRPFLFFSP